MTTYENRHDGIYITDTGPMVAEKAPEIEILLREMEKETAVLFENLNGLEARLKPVLLPESPQPMRSDTGTSTPAPPHSNLYNVLNDMRYRITGACILVSQIKARLEI